MKKMLFAIVLTVIALVICIEMSPASIHSSTVFSTEEKTQIQLNVLVNTVGPIDKDKLVNEIVSEHQKINGVFENSVYTLKLYRTKFHLRRGIVIDTIVCDREDNKKGL